MPKRVPRCGPSRAYLDKAFVVNRGEVLGVIDASGSGSGKSLLRIDTGQLAPDGGRLVIPVGARVPRPGRRGRRRRDRRKPVPISLARGGAAALGVIGARITAGDADALPMEDDEALILALGRGEDAQSMTSVQGPLTPPHRCVAVDASNVVHRVLLGHERATTTLRRLSYGERWRLPSMGSKAHYWQSRKTATWSARSPRWCGLSRTDES